MIKQMFVVLDSKAEIFGTPFFSHRRETAIRDFRLAVNEPGCPFGLTPQDYILMHIGDWNDESGVVNWQIPSEVCTALALKEPSHEVPES